MSIGAQHLIGETSNEIIESTIINMQGGSTGAYEGFYTYKLSLLNTTIWELFTYLQHIITLHKTHMNARTRTSKKERY